MSELEKIVNYQSAEASKAKKEELAPNGGSDRRLLYAAVTGNTVLLLLLVASILSGNRLPVSTQGTPRVPTEKWGYCAPEGEYCGNINLGQVTECCDGDRCSNHDDVYNWKCGFPDDDGGWCAPPGEFCGNINLGQITRCCDGDPCSDHDDIWNWKCA